MELRKNVKNRFLLFCLITVAVCFVLGYILLASLDKITHPAIEELFNSIFTVYTEFGMLIFPVLTIQMFSNDYKNKNILFYKLLGYGWLQFFVSKAVVSLLFLGAATYIGILAVSIIYGKFSYMGIMMFYFTGVLIYQVFLTSLWGFLFKNIIAAYVVNFAYWLFTIVASTATDKLDWFAYYDASNKVYQNFMEYLKCNDRSYLQISGSLIYSAGLIASVLVIVFVFRKRWGRNGI
ncbi:hypothetical protein [[Clostridium] polysaccharolyticum]|uniref:Putative peptide transport system permease protein n=1 Tax=[Clostridium] polysaccharolyticum TaxID=29364 RepID=A0A1I0AV33_9FIRM|nr:hypothetical protein [[Clostridium] polysaccharolyticum]SES98303.1 putative peptide transport system permease protein [[Clostridium] polysaccharolyticum]